MRAVRSTEIGKATIEQVPEPELSPDTIIVRPTYVGNNPCDYLAIEIEQLFKKGQTLGCDYSGIVAKIGSNVQTSLKPGDKVFGPAPAALGSDLAMGAFADLMTARAEVCFPIPKCLEESYASTLGIALATVGVSMYRDLGIPMPQDDPHFGRGKPFFVHSGSTTTGLMIIQFAKMSGFRVITTCSPHNFDLVKSRGADETYDYHNVEKCVTDIKASVGDELEYAYVCFMGDVGPEICSKILSTKGGKYATIVGGKCPRDDVQTFVVAGQALVCDPYLTMAGFMDQTAELKALSSKFWKWTLKLLEEGKIQPPPVDIRNGLDGALQGIDDLRNGKISGKKIVSRLG